ncbi:response regulator transcription factor [Amycolatopsis sp. cg5]|uniref:response regulator transcription factor n=1 Tax=Amycolatopsis sp. cg5 TaxID=3238802 RepID=UPI00352502CC
MATADDRADAVRVLLVEDHDMVAEALRLALAAFPEIELVERANSLETGVAAADRLRPQVVLLDRRLPDGDAIEAIGRFAPARVLVLTGDANPKITARLLDAGGAGLVLKSGMIEDLAAAIGAVAAGGIVIDRELLPSGLTAREREVLSLIAAGAGTERIAGELSLARTAVRDHIDRILAKTGARSRLEAVAYARRTGLID